MATSERTKAMLLYVIECFAAFQLAERKKIEYGENM